MSILNERNDNTKGVIHLLVTSLCNRKCKYCCNTQYDLNDIPYVTDEELREAHTICITGGEPFAFSDPCAFAKYYKYKYPNIQKVFVYTNALELGDYLQTGRKLTYLDGLTISIKNDSLENSRRVDFEEPAIFSNTATINNLPKDIDNYLSAIEYLRGKHKRVLKPIEFIDFSN